MELKTKSISKFTIRLLCTQYDKMVDEQIWANTERNFDWEGWEIAEKQHEYNCSEGIFATCTAESWEVHEGWDD